jgi:endoglucanase
MKAGWNLGNVFDAADGKPFDPEHELDYLTSRKNPAASKELFKAVFDAGFKTIRLPCSWHNHVINEDYDISPAWLSAYKKAVDDALLIGFYVIINIHHDDEFVVPTSEKLESSWKFMGAIWRQVADIFKDYDERLLFESLNEPRLKGTEYEWKVIEWGNEIQRDALTAIMTYNERFVKLIRESGGKNAARYLLCPSHAANADSTIIPEFKIPDDERVIVSVHAYIPYPFALAPIGSDAATDKFDSENEADTAPIDKFMTGLYEKYTSKGIPVIIGEYGASNRGDNTSARAAWTEYYVGKAAEAGIICVWWDNGSFCGDYENFAIIRRDTLEFPYPTILAPLVKERLFTTV